MLYGEGNVIWHTQDALLSYSFFFHLCCLMIMHGTYRFVFGSKQTKKTTASSYAFLPGALASHMSKHYVKYLTFYQPQRPNATRITTTSLIDTDVALYYVRDFEKVEKNEEDKHDFADTDGEVLSSE